MKEFAKYILILLLLNSCATLMNQPTTTIKVFSDRPTKLTVNNKVYQFKREQKIKVERKNDTLVLFAESDSISKQIKLIPKNSFGFYANIYYLGIGFIWDYKRPKRYTYQRDVFIDYHSTNKFPDRFLPTRKGQINLICTLPWINSFYLKPQNEPSKLNTGFWGISMGLEYYYKNNKFINLTASAVSDFFLPVPAAVDLSGEYELMSSSYFSLTDNYQFKLFTVGYGINYSKNSWDYRYYIWGDTPPPTRDPVKKLKQSFGFTFNGYYQFGKHFYLGLIYRPTLITVHPIKEFKYEHLMSIDFGWKFKLRK